MKRFVFLTFTFLGWAFYELSGGADFEPRTAAAPEPVALASVESGAKATRTARLKAGPKERRLTTEAAGLVARGAVSQRDAMVIPASAPANAAMAGGGEPSVLGAAGVTQNASVFAAAQSSGEIRLASLTERGTDLYGRSGMVQPEPEPTGVVAETVAYEEPVPDLREVTGVRVNMRNGPGTTYDVIARVTLGQSVEVLRDPGNGWLRLRTLPERRVGWISASLISRKAN